jgi:hypothetical protein
VALKPPLKPNLRVGREGQSLKILDVFLRLRPTFKYQLPGSPATWGNLAAALTLNLIEGFETISNISREGYRVMLIQHNWRHQEAPKKGLIFLPILNFPFKTRRASQKRAGIRAVLFERSEFHCSPPSSRSAAQPEGPRFMGVFFWLLFLYAQEK